MTQTDRRAAAWLCLALTCLYALSAGGHLYAADDQQKFSTIDALWRHGTFAIEGGWAEGVGGRRFAWFPLGASLLMMPGYLAGTAVAAFVPGLPPTETARAAIAFQNSAFTAGLATMLFLASRLFGFSRRRALFAALAFALGTAAWPYAKTAWSEPGAAVLVFGGLLALWRGAREPASPAARWLVGAGACLGAACLVREELALVALGGLGWLAWRERAAPAVALRALALVGAPLLVAAAVSGWYQHHRFGSPWAFPNFRGPQTQVSSEVTDRIVHVLDTLRRWTVHPNQALVYFSPPLLLGILGWRRFSAQAPDAAALFLAALGPLVAFYVLGWGQSTWAWGLRYGYLFLPFLLLPAAALAPTRATRLAAAGLLAAGVAVQLIAVPQDFTYLYLREMARSPGTNIHTILDRPAQGPLMLAARELPHTVAEGVAIWAAPPGSTPLAEASREARRAGAPDFWWVWLAATEASRGLIMVGAGAIAATGLLAAVQVARAAASAPGGPFPPGRPCRTLVAFGTYDARAPRLAMLLAGWRATGGQVVEVNEPLWPEAGERAALAARGGEPGLAWRWLRAQARLWRRRGELARADAILVPYPGHLDMPLARLLASRAGLPLVFDPFISLYDTAVVDRALFSPRSPRGRLCRAADRLALGLADRVLADTAAHGAYLADLGGLTPDRIAVVPVGADERLFVPRQQEGAPTGGVEVLFYGRMAPLHGVDVVLRAAKLLEAEPGLRFHVVGQGQVPIERLLAEVGASNVRWTPAVPYEALPALLAEADICLGVFADGPKAARVVPHKVYEAAAMGKPIVTRDSPAVRAAFPADALVMVPPGDPEALAAALRQLAAAPARRAALGQAAAGAHAAAYTRAGIGAALIAAMPGARVGGG